MWQNSGKRIEVIQCKTIVDIQNSSHYSFVMIFFILLNMIIAAVLAVYVIVLKSWLKMLTIEVERLKIKNASQSDMKTLTGETTDRRILSTVTLKNPSSLPIGSSFYEGGLI